MKIHPKMKIELLEDYKFIGNTRTKPFRATLKKGEIGVYFAHSHCFVFEARRGWRPYIFVSYLDKHLELFKEKIVIFKEKR